MLIKLTLPEMVLCKFLKLDYIWCILDEMAKRSTAE